jgi:putative endonuclease
MNKNWFVYIAICKDKTFYTGITNNLEKRELTHNQGKGAAYTKTRTPIRIIYSEKHLDRSCALKRELEIKSWTRKEKENLIAYDITTKK